MPTRFHGRVLLPLVFVCAVGAPGAAQAPAAPADNPLIEVARRASSEPGYRPPYDRVRPEHVVPAIEQLLAEAEQQRDDFRTSTGPRTWANTMLALEQMGQSLWDAFSVVRVLQSVAQTPELRAAFNAVQPKVSAYSASIGLDPDIAARVREYAETDEAKALTGAHARALRKTLDGFRRSGAYLDEAARARLQAISTESSRLSTTFSQHVLDSTNAFEVIVTDERQLAGLPESARQAAAASAKARGTDGWRFTLQAPSLSAVMRFMDDASIRERMFRAQMAVAADAPYDNRSVMAQLLALRRERASLLGYRTFADFQTEDRMAGSGEHVRTFLGELETKARPFFEKENAEIAAFRRSLEGPDAPALTPWDISYYAEKMRQQFYALDEERLRPYFSFEGVLNGMFTLVNRLYGITVRQAGNPAVWHPDVRFYEIVDADGTRLASFYADFFPRESKNAGAWMNTMIVGGPRREGQGFLPHLGMIAGNVTPPVGDRPSLLTHGEVETLWHEFGHLLHLALSRSPIRSLAGTNVAWDYVEFPSQIMENFTWERPVVDLFARHYETGEPLPEELFQALVRARTFRAANAMMGQLAFATQDLLLHTEYAGDEGSTDVVTYARDIAQRFASVPLPEGFARIASFSHLFSGGYAAGYYSYKWAEVLDADAFTLFQTQGVFSEEAGRRFRRTILETGDTEDPAVLFRQLMGRDPDVNALLRRDGLN